MDYKQKYLKYKQKYVELKQQMGGELTPEDLEEKKRLEKIIEVYKKLSNIMISGALDIEYAKLKADFKVEDEKPSSCQPKIGNPNIAYETRGNEHCDYARAKLYCLKFFTDPYYTERYNIIINPNWIDVQIKSTYEIKPHATEKYQRILVKK